MSDDHDYSDEDDDTDDSNVTTAPKRTRKTSKKGKKTPTAQPAKRKAKEPASVDGDVCWFPRSLVQSRHRMGKAGVLLVSVDDGRVSFALHAVFPALEKPLEEKVQNALQNAVRDRGGIDDDARKSVLRAFWKANREPPEVIVLGATPSHPH